MHNVWFRHNLKMPNCAYQRLGRTEFEYVFASFHRKTLWLKMKLTFKKLPNQIDILYIYKKNSTCPPQKRNSG